MTDGLLLFSGTAAPVPTKALYGALAILGPFAYGPRPGQPNNCLFLDQLDVVDEATAAEGLRQYRDVRGYTETACGPCEALGYHGQYPDTHWLARGPVAYAEQLERRFRGLSRTLFLLPDIAPWFNGREYDWDAIERDLTPFYSHPAMQAVCDRVVTAWETVVSIEEFARVFDWAKRVYPTKPRDWHNPPGHLSPGLSSEDEQTCWRSAAAHGCTGLQMQAGPPSGAGGDGRTAKEQMQYDLWDMQRRFQGVNSPWGPPILNPQTGEPLTLRYREGVTYDLYWHATPESVAKDWGLAACAVANVLSSGDGYPVP